ncbi:hypothetical protein BDF19DRAFT_422132 [Syncephalis fuscata]|nr:hypothetical protein BDF19DRAFT_422132 [Syncephalis fuscata]
MASNPPEDTKSNAVRSEDIVVEKWDRCVAHTLVQTGVGLGVGIVASVLFFKRRAWPVTLGAGFGIGTAYTECQSIFRPPGAFYKPVDKSNERPLT